MPEVSDATEEVVNGEVRITPPAKWIHALTVGNIRDALMGQLDRPEFHVATAQFGLVIRMAPLTVRVPDLAVFEDSKIIERDGYVHSAPQLVAEVILPGEPPDEELTDYAAIGVPEVWVVTPAARTVEVLCLEDGKLHCTQILADEGALTPREFPHVRVETSSFWPD